MKPIFLIAMALLGLSQDARSDNCDAIKAQIESRFRSGGITSPKLEAVDAGSLKGARVVGTCASSTRQIVYLGSDRQAALPSTTGTASTAGAGISRAAPAPAAAPDNIPTECKDGSIVIGPNCDNPRAARMSSNEIAGSVVAAPKASGN